MCFYWKTSLIIMPGKLSNYPDLTMTRIFEGPGNTDKHKLPL
ncbi:hypothetical protein ACU8KH_04737 [Lachancea thermotolerans]